MESNNTLVNNILELKNISQQWGELKARYHHKAAQIPMAEYNEYINRYAKLQSKFVDGTLMHQAIAKTINELKSEMVKTPRTPRKSKFRGGKSPKKSRKSRKKSRKSRKSRKKSRKR